MFNNSKISLIFLIKIYRREFNNLKNEMLKIGSDFFFVISNTPRIQKYLFLGTKTENRHADFQYPVHLTGHYANMLGNIPFIRRFVVS